MIPDKLKLIKRIPRSYVITLVACGIFAATFISVAQFTGAKYATALAMAILYFLHLGISAGCGYTIIHLWQYRDNPLIKRMAVYMHAAPITALTSIVLIFMAKGVTLTWKFTITMFVGTLLADAVRLPFVVYVLRGQTSHAVPNQPEPADMRAPS